MSDTVDALVLDLVEWVAKRERTYAAIRYQPLKRGQISATSSPPSKT